MSLEQAIQNAADALNRYCDILEKRPVQEDLPLGTKTGPAEFNAEKKTPAKKAAKKAPKKETPKVEEKAPEQPAETEAEKSLPEVSVGDLRKVGTALVANGYKDEFLAALGEVEAKNVTSVADDKRGPLLAKLESILGRKLSEIED